MHRFASRFTKMCFSGKKKFYLIFLWLISGSSLLFIYLGNGYEKGIQLKQPTLTSAFSSSETNNQSSRVAYLLSHGPKNWTVNCDGLWVTSHMGGRLGNQMCEYAHLLLLYIEHGIQVGLVPSMNDALRETFPNLSLDVLPSKCQEDVYKRFSFFYSLVVGLNSVKIKTYHWDTIDTMLSNRTLNDSVASGNYPCDASRLWKYRDIWRKEFTFSPTVYKKAKVNIKRSLGVWRSQTGLKKSLPLQVGVHVRRTDYIPYLKEKTGANGLEEDYFIKAFNYFRKRYGNVAFLLSSDDRDWCQKMLKRNNIKDVVVIPDAYATEDLAVLSMSNHLIMSVGTYGFWAAVLSKDSVIFPKYVGRENEYSLTKDLRKVNSSDLVPLF